MRIKANTQPPKPSSAVSPAPKTHLRSIFFRTSVGLVLVIVLLTGTFLVVKDNFPNARRGLRTDIATLGIVALDKNYGGDSLATKMSLKESIFALPKHIARSFRFSSTSLLPQLNIDIAFKPLQKLHAKRAAALKAHLLVKGEDDFVPAKIRYKDTTTKVKVRLKGDHTDHMKGDKWSLRVHTKGKSQLLSQRRFSLQHPRTRGYHAELVFFATLLPYNIITPRYSFVNVVRNGDDLGIMAMEEHFAKELLESNDRKEGVIIRFDESYVWHQGSDNRSGFKGIYDNYRNTSIDAFQSSKIKNSPRLHKEYDIAVGLLRSFMKGKLTASEVFNAEQMGSYIAVAQFWGAWHALRWHNLRFYLNPLTMKLEPIAFDANLHERKSVGTDITHEPIISEILQDDLVYAVFNNVLDELVQQTSDGTLVSRLKKVETASLEILREEYFLLKSFDFDELNQRAALAPRTREALSKSHIKLIDYPIFVLAHHYHQKDTDYIEIANALPHPVQISRIAWQTNPEATEKAMIVENVKYPLILAPTVKNGEPQYTKIALGNKAPSKAYELYVDANIIDTDLIRRTEVTQYGPPLIVAPIPNAQPEEFAKNNSFIDWDIANKSVHILPGEWSVLGNIVVPRRYKLIIDAGTTLHFQKNASMIVYGQTLFTGTKEKPIVLAGIGTTGTWGGIAVYNAEQRSKWQHVKVHNTTGISFPLWSLTGGATFYRSNVDMQHCEFYGNKAEDALNIIHSDFTQKNVSVMNTLSDGFDGDFVTGSIEGGTFQDIGLAGGGDGVDVSGSEIMINDTHFIRVDDKAISVGEGSQLTAKNVSMIDSGVGAASKDRSNLRIDEAIIRNARIAGLMAYVKKPEFGPASLFASGIKFIDSPRTAVAQQGNSLSLNGQIIKPQKIDIDKLYDTVMKPGLR